MAANDDTTKAAARWVIIPLYYLRFLKKKTVAEIWRKIWSHQEDIPCLCEFHLDSGDGSRERVLGARTTLPWDEAFFLIFSFKICLPHQSVTPFLSAATPPKKSLDPSLGSISHSDIKLFLIASTFPLFCLQALRNNYVFRNQTQFLQIRFSLCYHFTGIFILS